MSSGKLIFCEEPFNKMWNLFVYYQNEEVTKEILYTAYCTLKEEKEANLLAYQNTLKFIYLLKQGMTYFQAAQQSELMVKPLLLYYGITSFMKALILINDPYYPSSTTILQHGLTTRKKKKNHYLFIDDIVKVQQEGLLPHFSKTVLNKTLATNSKFKVGDLFGLIPELQDSIFRQLKYKTMLPLSIQQKDRLTWKFSFLQKDLDEQQLHFSIVYDLFLAGVSLHKQSIRILDQEKALVLKAKHADFRPEQHHFQIFEDYKGNHYFYFLHSLPPLEEIIIYNLLMYVLGMLCRYDSEHWGEILYSFHSPDLFLIEEFLQITLRKFPNIILNYISKEKLFFKTL